MGRNSLALTAWIVASAAWAIAGCNAAPGPCVAPNFRVGVSCVYRCGDGGYCYSDGGTADVHIDDASSDIAIDVSSDAADSSASCADGEARCGAACADTSTDMANCGACGRTCAAHAHSSATCVGGECQSTCDAGFADCDGNPATGCEVELATSVDHCGSCATHCAGAPNAGPACVAGVCRTACASGFADCDMNTANGCETATDANLMNCGACGNVCPMGPHSTPTCSAGRCGVSCINDPSFWTQSWQDCDGAPANGCETDIFSDAHCGQRCGYGPCSTGTTCDQGDCCMPNHACMSRP